MVKITPIQAFRDNYIWALYNQRHAVLVDPGDAKPCIAFLEQHGLMLTAILITHSHHDHTGGIEALTRRFPAPVYGPHLEPVTGLTHPVKEGDQVKLAEIDLEFTVLETPGHTLGHIAFYGIGRLFCGDTLFACGCGRLFEGTPAMMFSTLKRLAQLPDNTEIFCAHEYTLSNISFAKTVDPENTQLAERQQHALAMREAGRPTLPSQLSLEKATNPFLRCGEAALIRTVESWLARPITSEIEVFAELRQAKNNFS